MSAKLRITLTMKGNGYFQLTALNAADDPKRSEALFEHVVGTYLTDDELLDHVASAASSITFKSNQTRESLLKEFQVVFDAVR